MKLLLVNGNTSDGITRLIEAEARRVLPGAEIVAATAAFGGRYIATRAERAIAAHAVLDALARHHPGCNAAVIACFGEPGLDAARELLPIPVVGMAEAAMLTACMLGGRFGIVTGGARWVPMLRELAASYGLEGRLAGVRAHALTGAEIAGDQEAAATGLAELGRRLVEEDGAECIILGGAGLAGLGGRIGPLLPVPLLDGLDCALRQAALLAALGARRPAAGSFAPPGRRDTTGLSPELAALLRGAAT